jgi:hypothetical protein
MASIRLSVLLAAALLPVAAAATTPPANPSGSITLLHFVPSAETVTTQSFRCDAGAAGAEDGQVRYSRRRTADGMVGGFEAITLRGVGVSAATLAAANARVGSRHIEYTVLGCQADGALELLVRTWQPGVEGEAAWSGFAIQRAADGTESVHE